LGTLAASLFWNGIVSVFVLLVTSSTLQHLGITAPHWFPVPEMDGENMGVGMTAFLWLFLSPFIVIGISMVGAFFMSVGGKTEIKMDRNEGSVFTGVGPIGYRRRFLIADVSDVRIDDNHWRDSDGDRQGKTFIVIAMKEGKSIRLGSMLSGERRKFLAALLRKTLVR
jgi:hypothetical protein